MRRQYSLDRELFFQKPYNFFSQFIVVKSIEFINKQKADFIGMFIPVKKSQQSTGTIRCFKKGTKCACLKKRLFLPSACEAAQIFS